MKNGTIRHRKVYALAGILGVRRAEAVGILTGFWELTGEQFPDGDVSKAPLPYLSELSLWYPDRGQELIDALRNAVLLDVLPDGRLYVHDWHDHCENTVHRKLWRRKGWFANGLPPKIAALDGPDKAEARKWYSENKPPELRQNSNGIPTETLRLPALAVAVAVTSAVTTLEEEALPAAAGGVVSAISDSGKPAEKQPARKPKPKNPKPKAEPKPRERNLYWDAVCDIFGMNPVTEQDQKRMGRLARDFKLKCEAMNVDPDEIEARRDVLAARWAKDDVPAVVTPEALLKHWDSAEDQSQSVDFRDPTPEETAMMYADFDAQPAAVKKPKLEAFLKHIADIGQIPDEENAARIAKVKADIEAEEALEGAGA
jgi:hypothetical protein